MYTQVLIRCHSGASEMPAGFEEIDQSGQSIWVCEPDWHTQSIAEQDAYDWLREQLEHFKSFVAATPISYTLTVFLEVTSERAPLMVSLPPSLLELISVCSGTLEVYISD